MDTEEFHRQMTSGECVCGHHFDDHQFGDYYPDPEGPKCKHYGECGQCGCQGYA